MPIYEYEREDKTRFEVRQSFHDEALRVCPTTGQSVRRVLSAAGIIFKGSGWYITDSRPATNGGSESKPAESSASETTSDSSATKTETKAETKTETRTEASANKKAEAAA